MLKIAEILQNTLSMAGWAVNEEKLCQRPSQMLMFLRVVLDLLRGKAFVTDRRPKEFCSCLKNLEAKERVNAKELAKITGYLVSCL